jgi:uncharacterized protein
VPDRQELSDALEGVLRSSPLISRLLDRWEEIALPNAWLVAGAVAQTVWNDVSRLPPQHGIKDVDLVYFDAGDLSAERERDEEARIRHLFAGLGASLDVKNEARVHLWYEAKFGKPIAAYSSAEEAIATFPTVATSVGVRPLGDRLEMCAPFGLDDLFGLVVRPNRRLVTRDAYEAKVARWRRCWPALTIVEWS